MGRNDCITLDEAIQEFEFDCKIRHRSRKTIDNYHPIHVLANLQIYFKRELQEILAMNTIR